MMAAVSEKVTKVLQSQADSKLLYAVTSYTISLVLVGMFRLLIILI